MKVIIAGGRYFDNYDLLCQKVDYYLSRQSKVEIVSGAAKGADKLGERYAEERQYPIKRFIADWGTWGKRAGYLRNEEMAEYADALIAFWDGRSKGTKHMINLAKKLNLSIRIIRY
jgi:hypothetical protein